MTHFLRNHRGEQQLATIIHHGAISNSCQNHPYCSGWVLRMNKIVQLLGCSPKIWGWTVHHFKLLCLLGPFFSPYWMTKGWTHGPMVSNDEFMADLQPHPVTLRRNCWMREGRLSVDCWLASCSWDARIGARSTS